MCNTVQAVKRKTVALFLMAPRIADLDRLIAGEIYLIVYLVPNSASCASFSKASISPQLSSSLFSVPSGNCCPVTEALRVCTGTPIYCSLYLGGK